MRILQRAVVFVDVVDPVITGAASKSAVYMLLFLSEQVYTGDILRVYNITCIVTTLADSDYFEEEEL